MMGYMAVILEKDLKRGHDALVQWLRLACGITTWAEEKDAGHISAVGERDDLSDLLPL